MSSASVARYDPTPTYPPVGGHVVAGWEEILGCLPSACRVLAVDGPAAVDWARLRVSLHAAATAAGCSVTWLDMREQVACWDQVLKRTAGGSLAGDPDFAPLATGSLADLFDALPLVPPPDRGLLIVYGPGAALVGHDQLWYADLPKRYAEAAVGEGTAPNLGQSADAAGSVKRLFYVDWPLLDRHRDAIAARIDRWIDTQDLARPASLDGASLRRTLAGLARRPFRTRPTFNTTSWGGHWGQRALGFNPQAPNTALGYELIAPESGVLVGTTNGPSVEVPFQLVVSAHPAPLLGSSVHAAFGTSFPIRFDYLDTVGGGNLSVHCHPREDAMREVFGWPYAQHETYYIMVGGDDRRVFLGLREDSDIQRFHRKAHAADNAGVPFDIDAFVQTFPAIPHQLFLIPAGTPHGSGEGNVVLEVSATPYLYSLRFYDWLREDSTGRRRPVHVDHAFRNLDPDRRGETVRRDLVQPARVLASGQGWREELIGRLPDMFFDVRRMVIDSGQTAPGDTGDRFHVLNVVEGAGVRVETTDGHRHQLSYAETLVIPGAVGRYRMTATGRGSTRLVKAQVR